MHKKRKLYNNLQHKIFAKQNIEHEVMVETTFFLLMRNQIELLFKVYIQYKMN